MNNDFDRINNIRKNLYQPLRKSGLMPSVLNPGKVAGPGAAAGFARGGIVNGGIKRTAGGRGRPTRVRPVARGRRNFAGRKYARGGFVNNFTTRRSIRSSRRNRTTIGLNKNRWRR